MCGGYVRKRITLSTRGAYDVPATGRNTAYSFPFDRVAIPEDEPSARLLQQRTDAVVRGWAPSLNSQTTTNRGGGLRTTGIRAHSSPPAGLPANDWLRHQRTFKRRVRNGLNWSTTADRPDRREVGTMTPFPVAFANDDIRQYRPLPAQSHPLPDTSKQGRLPISILEMAEAECPRWHSSR